MSKYMVFSGRKLIEIKGSCIAEYEQKIGAFTENTVNYLIATLGLTEEQPVEALAEEIEKAMLEDCRDSEMVKGILSDEKQRGDLFMAENKFAKRETERKASVVSHSSAAEMSEAAPKKKLMSMKVSEDMLKKFTFINKKKGISNTAVLNMYIAEYVAANSDLL